MPLLLFGCIGIACTIAFQLSIPPPPPSIVVDRLGLWVQAWLISLTCDFFLVQTLMAFVRIWMRSKVLVLRRGGRRSIPTQPPKSPTSTETTSFGSSAKSFKAKMITSAAKHTEPQQVDEENENVSSSAFRWQAATGRVKMGDDFLLIQDEDSGSGGGGSAEESDGPARELIELIFGMNQAQNRYEEDHDVIEHFDVIGGEEEEEEDDLLDEGRRSITPPPPAVPTMQITPTRPGITPYSSSPIRPKQLFVKSYDDDEGEEEEEAIDLDREEEESPVLVVGATVSVGGGGGQAPKGGVIGLHMHESGSIANSDEDAQGGGAFIDLVEARERIRLETIV
jgi:hypothetical protein